MTFKARIFYGITSSCPHILQMFGHCLFLSDVLFSLSILPRHLHWTQHFTEHGMFSLSCSQFIVHPLFISFAVEILIKVASRFGYALVILEILEQVL